MQLLFSVSDTQTPLICLSNSLVVDLNAILIRARRVFRDFLSVDCKETRLSPILLSADPYLPVVSLETTILGYFTYLQL